MRKPSVYSRLLILCVLFVISVRAFSMDDIKPVPFTSVHITDQFWRQRLDTLRSVTIRYAFQKCEEAGQLRNFEYAGRINSGKAKVGELTFQSGQPYDDAEVYKVLEGASYLLTVQKDAELEAYCDKVVNIICAAQEPDGYIQTNFTIHNPLHPWYNGEKWKSDWNLSHETFNVAELIESAIAYYQATGKNKLLKCAIKAADNMCRVFNSNGIHMAPGHAVIEMALVRLYELTHDKKYLNTCKFFLDCRGIRKFNSESNDLRVNGKYWQDHLPAIQQRTAEGHAVRAFYFYSGMADWVRYSGDQEYQEAIDAIWQNISSRKAYITGGFGARDNNEAFGEDYELPNATAYCETCASVSATMFNERMFRLHGDAKYIDVLERALYNTVLDGLSVYGTSFYYPNRLEVSKQGNKRNKWFGTSCCPTNLCRLIPSFPSYVYATNSHSLYLNLFVNSTANIVVGGEKFALTQTTDYPYSGNIVLKFSFKGRHAKSDFKDLRIRIPGWAVNEPFASDLYRYTNPTTQPVKIQISGRDYAYAVEKGYAVIPASEVRKGEIEINLPMDVHQVKSNEKLISNHSLRSYERGPLVYCIEGADNENNLENLYLPGMPKFQTERAMNSIFRGGLVQLSTKGVRINNISGTISKQESNVCLIPYFARAYRNPSAMKVWIPADSSTLEAAMTFIDKVEPCNEQSEKAHNLQGEKMATGSQLGWRDSRGGYIAYTMAVSPSEPVDLVVKQWGSDYYNRNYEIYIDDIRVSYDELDKCAPGRYYFTHHALPFELTKGKQSVRVRLQSVNNSVVGGIFGVYTVLSASEQKDVKPIDYLWPDNEKSIIVHQFRSNAPKTEVRCRTALNGSGKDAMQWKMKVNPTNRNYLQLYFRGDKTRAYDFSIYADNTLVENVKTDAIENGKFYFRSYPLPEEATSGKKEVNIRLSATGETSVAPIFYVYMMSTPIVQK